jgi:hypothetical protein
VKFTTIYPGWCQGRTIQIHFRIRTCSGTAVRSNFVSRIFFDDAVNNVVLANSAYSRSTARDTSNARDGIYNVANNDRMLAILSGGVNSGCAATITVASSFHASTGGAPNISAGGVASAAGGVDGVAPGSWISIYGSNFSTVTRALARRRQRPDQRQGGLSSLRQSDPGERARAGRHRGGVDFRRRDQLGWNVELRRDHDPTGPAGLVRLLRLRDHDLGEIRRRDLALGHRLRFCRIGAVYTGAYETTNAVKVTIGGVPTPVSWPGSSDPVSIRST